VNPEFATPFANLIDRTTNLLTVTGNPKKVLTHNAMRNTQDSPNLLLRLPFIEVELDTLGLATSQLGLDNLTNLF